MSTGYAERPTLNVLVCDSDPIAGSLLTPELRANPVVSKVELVRSINEANDLVRTGANNVVFIDPLTLGLDEASSFIFATRLEYEHIVFVLFVDRAAAESRRESFYDGDRSRFLHYYALDKRTPLASFPQEVSSVLEKCLSWIISKAPIMELQELRVEASTLASSEDGTQDVALQSLTAKIDEVLKRLPSGPTQPHIRSNTVFLSCRFSDSQYIDGLRDLLTESGFEVIMGDNAAGFISESILERIRECEFFLCLMTRDKEKTDGTYTTSPWLLEEKGAALAFGKYLVLLVEEGVTDFGGLQGDWQRHHFSEKGFTIAALKAVRQLRSAAGGSQP